jgi:hypothetical protein
MQSAFGTADVEAVQKKLEETGQTADDFIKTIVTEFEKLPKVTGGVANTIENFQDTLKNLKVELGNALLPTFVQILDILAKLAKWFSDLPKPIKDMTAYIIAGGAALTAFGAIIPPISAALGVAKGAMMGLTSVMMANPILAVVGAVAALTIGIIAYNRHQKAVKMDVERLTKSFSEAKTEMDKLAKADALITEMDTLAKKTSLTSAESDRLKEIKQELITISPRLANALRDENMTLNQQVGAAKNAVNALKGLNAERIKIAKSQAMESQQILGAEMSALQPRINVLRSNIDRWRGIVEQRSAKGLQSPGYQQLIWNAEKELAGLLDKMDELGAKRETALAIIKGPVAESTKPIGATRATVAPVVSTAPTRTTTTEKIETDADKQAALDKWERDYREFSDEQMRIALEMNKADEEALIASIEKQQQESMIGKDTGIDPTSGLPFEEIQRALEYKEKLIADSLQKQYEIAMYWADLAKSLEEKDLIRQQELREKGAGLGPEGIPQDEIAEAFKVKAEWEQKAYNDALKLAEEQRKKQMEIWEGLASDISSVFARIPQDLIQNFDDIGSVFKNFAMGLLNSIASMVSQIIQQKIFMQLMSAFDTAIPQQGGGGFGFGDLLKLGMSALSIGSGIGVVPTATAGVAGSVEALGLFFDDPQNDMMAYKSGERSAITMTRKSASDFINHFEKGFSKGSDKQTSEGGLGVRLDKLIGLMENTKYEFYLDSDPIVSTVRKKTNKKIDRGEWAG